MKRLIYFMVLISSQLQAQIDSSNLVKYSPDFNFHDGLFLNFEQVKKNQPIPITRILSTLDYNDINFFKELVEQKEIEYYDAFGNRQAIKTDNLWGFTRRGKLYIQYQGEFNRIPIVGAISHFIADITYFDNQYDDYYYNRYYSGYSNYYYDPYYYRPQTRTAKRELRQFIIDFETGKIYDYDIKAVEILLMRDPELHDEFSALKRRKKKQLKFFFIRRYNEANPIYFPKQ